MTTSNTEHHPERRPHPQDRVQAPLVPAAVGVVHYDVHAECPHCGKGLALNQYPYNDDRTEYSLAEDDLGLALFGTVREPARWTELNIEYTCCGCRKQFRLVQLEI